MKNGRILLGALALVAVPAVAVADDWAAPAPAPVAGPIVAPACRVAVIPAQQMWVDRQVTRPPVTVDRQVPITETVQVPLYGQATVPEVRAVEVPVYAQRAEPVKLSLWNPFGCEDFEIKLWDTCECVQVGSQVQHQVVNRVETVPAGTVSQQRVVGWRTETVVVEPARTETVREPVWTPERTVTVGPIGSRPLPGTVEVMTEEQYRAALAVR
jgi:hypothetical protein